MKRVSKIAENLEKIRATLPFGTVLTAVSKFHPVESLKEAYAAGQRVFGESRVQELQRKVELMPADTRWHFIGHLQSNKVRALVKLPVDLVESVDSERILNLIDDESAAAGKITRVLLQLHVAAEETKTGFSPDELADFFERRAFRKLKATHICGIMGMASNTDDTRRIADDFNKIAAWKHKVREMCGDELQGFDIVSMGMSHDYPIALQCGSTMVRVGTAIFGEREY